MEILAEARDNKQLWSMKVSCTGRGWHQTGHPCGRLLKINAADVKSRSHTDMTGCTDTYYGVVCPVCGCFTEIPTSKVPYDVQHMAESY